MSAISAVGNWMFHTRAGQITTAAVGLGVLALVAAGCADNTPPPQPTDNEDGPLLNQLRAMGFTNRQQHVALNDVHANAWSHNEAGNTLSQLAGTSLSTGQALDAYRLIKVNNRSTSEMTGMVQALDSQTQLYASDIMRVLVDVVSTGYPANYATQFFTARQYNPNTSTSQDIHDFEAMLGLRYPRWQYPGPTVIYNPYPDPYYNGYPLDPGYGYPTSPGDDYNGYPGGGYPTPGSGGTSPGDDYPTYPGNGGSYPGSGGSYPGSGSGGTSPGDDYPGSGNGTYPGSGGNYPTPGDDYPGSGGSYPGSGGNDYPTPGDDYSSGGGYQGGSGGSSYPSGGSGDDYPVGSYPSSGGSSSGDDY